MKKVAASVCTALALLASLAVVGGAQASPNEPPNIVVFYVDDARVDDVERFMPFAHAWFSEGVEFVNSGVENPLCCPSRAAFISGQRGINNGVQSNSEPNGRYSSFIDKEDNLGAWLSAAGYYTLHTGKQMKGAGRFPMVGWDDWRAVHPSPSCQFNCRWRMNGTLVQTGGASSDCVTYLHAEHANEIISSQDRYFVRLAFSHPHVHGGGVPPIPCREHKGLYADLLPQDSPTFEMPTRSGDFDLARLIKLVRGRAESLASVDEAIRRVVQHTIDEGKLDNTIFLLTSDNGYLLGEHADVGKVEHWRESFEVPFFVRGPGYLSGTVDERVVSNIDIAPTLVGWAGAEQYVGRTFDGVALEAIPDGRAMVFQRHRPALSDPWYLAVWDGDRVLIDFRNQPKQSLMFDHRVDGYEQTDIHGQPGTEELEAALTALDGCAGAACLVTIDDGSPTTTSTMPTTSTTMGVTTTTAPVTTTTGPTTTGPTTTVPERSVTYFGSNEIRSVEVVINGADAVVNVDGTGIKVQVKWRPVGSRWQWLPVADGEDASFQFIAPSTEIDVQVRAYKSGQWRAWTPRLRL